MISTNGSDSESESIAKNNPQYETVIFENLSRLITKEEFEKLSL